MASAALEGTAGGSGAASSWPRRLLRARARRRSPGGSRRERDWRLGALRCLLVGAAGGGIGWLAVGDGSIPSLAGGLPVALFGAAGCAWVAGLGARRELEREVEDRSHELWLALSELEVAQAETVRRLSMAVEFRDKDTGAHIERIGRLSALLAERLGKDEAFCTRLLHAAPLHDVGKVAVPDAVLLKPGQLTEQERAIVQAHAEEGYQLLSRSSSSILEMAATIALTHHERYDGSGYPRGLAGEEIPLEGRIVAVTDVFDALTSDRVYRKAYPLDQALALMREQRGRHFDPQILDAFLEMVGGAGGLATAGGNRRQLLAGIAEVFAKALEQGDPVMAEGAVSQAIEDGVPPEVLQGELLGPAIRRIYELRAVGDLDAEGELRATAIARRVLATLFRVIVGAERPQRESILVAGLEGEQRSLELQLAHDLLAAAGFEVALVPELAPERLAATISRQRPQAVVVVGSTPALAPVGERLCRELAQGWQALPILVCGEVAKAMEGSEQGVITVDPVERCVAALDSLLYGRVRIAGGAAAR